SARKIRNCGDSAPSLMPLRAGIRELVGVVVCERSWFTQRHKERTQRHKENRKFSFVPWCPHFVPLCEPSPAISASTLHRSNPRKLFHLPQFFAHATSVASHSSPQPSTHPQYHSSTTPSHPPTH